MYHTSCKINLLNLIIYLKSFIDTLQSQSHFTTVNLLTISLTWLQAAWESRVEIFTL
jgi:hypothetical protein